jgi:hypothetical protein
MAACQTMSTVVGRVVVVVGGVVEVAGGVVVLVLVTDVSLDGGMRYSNW